MRETNNPLVQVNLRSIPNSQMMSIGLEIDGQSYDTQISEMPSVPLEPWQINAFIRTRKYIQNDRNELDDARDNEYATLLLGTLLPTPILRGIFEHLGKSSAHELVLEINTTDPDISAYPWEICTYANWKKLGIQPPIRPIIIVRSASTYHEKWATESPTRILVAGVAPYGLASVNFEKERREIEESIGRVRSNQGSFQISVLREATLQSLSLTVQQYKPHIIHLVTHGKAGGHYFETSNGQPTVVSGSELIRALSGGQGTLCLFVSTACMTMMEESQENTWGLGKLLSSVVPITIGMQIAISEDAALAFTNEFYGSLAASYAVLEAFAQARERIRKERPGSPEWIAPVLYRGIKDNPVLFSPEKDIHQFLLKIKSELSVKLKFLQGQNSFEVSVNIEIWRSLLDSINQIDQILCDGLDEGHFLADDAQRALIRKMAEPISKSRGLLFGICALLETSGNDKEFRLKYSLGKDVSEAIATLKILRGLIDDLFTSYNKSSNI